ncbi:MAG TPA: hypothetical protein PKA20_17675 [Burkholderiaceae bacterium]|nr:hypothetical protein [Burkholderiaceae bacterium]
MKQRGKRGARGNRIGRASAEFTRGFVATGLLSMLQQHGRHPHDAKDGARDPRRVLRHAVQGGAALAAGTLATEAIAQREYAVAIVSIAAGAAAIAGAEQMLRPPVQPAAIGSDT